MAAELLRWYELRLLHCTLPTDQVHQSELTTSSGIYGLDASVNNSIIRLIELIEAGQYIEALSSQEVQGFFGDYSMENDSTADDKTQFYAELERIIEAYLVGQEDDNNEAVLGRATFVMSIAIAAFMAFVQVNVTGPTIELPPIPLIGKTQHGVKTPEVWARDQLMSDGSDLLGKFSSLQYIVFAKILLIKTKDTIFARGICSSDGLGSISWWIVRLLLLQQRMLVENCSSLFDQLQVFMGESLRHFGTTEKVSCYWGHLVHEKEAPLIVASLELEAGLVDHTFSRVDSARQHLESAGLAAGIKLSVTGALGFRTIHQVEPKAQKMLVVDRIPSNDLGDSPLGNEDGAIPHDNLCEGSEVLMAPRLLENDFERIDTLIAMHQELVIAECLLVENSRRLDDMERWEMAPYIEAIDAQRLSYFPVRFFCGILRIRWESLRGRTKERALTMMDKLVQSLSEPHPLVRKRMLTIFGVYLPTIPALRKEYGDLLVSHGLTGEALRLFEELELWDNLIFCYRLLEKKPAAVELIKTRLSETPNDPRLWCSLGDVTNDDSCYEKALKVSNNKSARAKRSLARSAYNRGDYEMSKVLWESAMALNSLYPDGWFAFGAAALKARDVDKALDAFTRAVQLDPTNGEAWHNIAVLHMIRKKNKESFIAFKEALKFKSNSWQMWEIFSRVAVDVGNFFQALEAIRRVLDLSGNKRVDVEVLEKILLGLETRAYSPGSVFSDTQGDHICSNQTTAAPESGNPRETVRLMELLGKTFQQIVRSGIGGPDIWGLYARWHRMKGDLSMCSEALLKQVRSYQGSDLWKDIDRFRKFANASLELCKVYIEISLSAGSARELQAASMHLRSTIKQGVCFSDTEEYKALEDCLDQVNVRIEANSASKV